VRQKSTAASPAVPAATTDQVPSQAVATNLTAVSANPALD
jgi:hypothetical protein